MLGATAPHGFSKAAHVADASVPQSAPMSEPLLANETVVMRFRQHPIALAHLLVPQLAVMVIAIVAVILVPRSFAGHDAGGIEAIIALAVIALALLWCVPRFLRWRFNVVTLTNMRVIESRGVFSREHDSLPVARIQAVKVHQRLSQRLYGCGDVEIESAGRDAIELLPFVPKANDFATAVEAEMAGQTTGPTV